MTLRHAADRIAGYRALWSVSADEPPLAGDFDRLPLTTKAVFACEPDRFRDTGVPTAALQHTGGTTRQPLIIQRGLPELRFIDEFFTAVIAEASPMAEPPLCVTVLGHFHGDPTPMPYPGPVLRLDVNDTYWDLRRLLSDPSAFMGRPIRQAILVGLESQLRVLTCRLIESGFDFSTSVVSSVHSTGDLMTTRLRRFYESTWRCPLTSRYGLSEVFGGAEHCRRCGYYHCDTHVLAEVVDPASGERIEQGHGILVLTSLFPFVQKQPMIRYRTGDVVELGPRDCDVDELAFTLKGREIHSLFEAGGGALLLGAEVYDLLDGIPDVAQSEFMEMFKSLHGVASHHDLGHLKYRVDFARERSPQELSLVVELRYTHYLYAEQASEVLGRIRRGVLERHALLRRRVADGAIDFRVTAAVPGSLAHVQVDETE